MTIVDDMSDVKSYTVHIVGRVQGVCFRFYTQEKANELGIHGWVRNLNDGSVEALISGADTSIKAMLAWLERGPPSATVKQVQVKETHNPPSPTGFRITY